MKVLALYMTNQHIADLYVEADRDRLARQVPKRPSALSRAVAAVRSAIASRPSATHTAAPAAA